MAKICRGSIMVADFGIVVRKAVDFAALGTIGAVLGGMFCVSYENAGESAE